MFTREKSSPHVSLDGIQLLASLSAAERSKIENQCHWKEFSEHQRIIEKGESYTFVYFLISGVATVLNYSSSGRAISYATIKSGDVFGELAAIDGRTRSAWVWATEPCQVAILPGDVFMELISEKKEVALALMRHLSEIIRNADEKIADLGLLGAEQRLCIELMRMANPDPSHPKGWIVSPKPKQYDLANLVGSSRETVSRILGHLAEEGVIRRGDNEYHIPDYEKLKVRVFS